MKKEKFNGAIYLTSEEQTKFVTASSAIMACQLMQLYYADKGYLTSNTIDVKNDKAELTVHFNRMPVAPIPSAYLYTQKEIRSHIYYDSCDNTLNRVRTITFYFKY